MTIENLCNESTLNFIILKRVNKCGIFCVPKAYEIYCF